ncbi:MAG: hypothetical protein K6U87_15980 [Firmicutes bacterium]|nr:hypothetical protein [Bacillota bacterium]
MISDVVMTLALAMIGVAIGGVLKWHAAGLRGPILAAPVVLVGLWPFLPFLLLGIVGTLSRAQGVPLRGWRWVSMLGVITRDVILEFPALLGVAAVVVRHFLQAAALQTPEQSFSLFPSVMRWYQQHRLAHI